MTQSYLPSRWLITSPQFANDPDIFPLLPGFSFITSKKPTWSTGIAEASSGRQRARQIWSYPKWQFKVGYEVLRDSATYLEQQKLLAFFNAHAGRYQQFFFYDPSDNAVSNQQFGVGDGTTTTFQLSRSINAGAITFTEPVKGIANTPTVAVAGTGTTAFTIGPLGQVAFTSAPTSGAVLTWSGNFMFLCRFDDDMVDTAQMMNGLWSAAGIGFTSIKS